MGVTRRSDARKEEVTSSGISIAARNQPKSRSGWNAGVTGVVGLHLGCGCWMSRWIAEARGDKEVIPGWWVGAG